MPSNNSAATTKPYAMWSHDFKEFVALLNVHRVEYLVMGDYAAGLHGAPRFTGDLDVWVNRTVDNAARLLGEFGFGGFNLKVEDFIESDEILQIGSPPFRIDVPTVIDGVQVTDSAARKVTVDYDGVRTDFIGLADLKQNQRATGWPQDLLDLAALEQVNAAQ